ncbi:MAG: Co2+/Mg2+ efflux protein ApaG [Alphaproteobacteria bacterium]|nr:Co2+/Mg2+ efflux protein ApaG [Alphaproteobacteria bacterium]
MGSEPTYTQTTHAVSVSVLPIYLKNQSRPVDNVFVWAYNICIENKGSHAFQLISRYWKITDALGRIQEVRGGGVIGEQPILRPGENFEYTSSVTLTLPSGIMVGSYKMQIDGGESFDVAIPLFSLDSPHEVRTIH